MLNFSLPFNTTSDFNQTALFTNFSKASGTANNIGPTYFDGAMFTNDYELWTYGGAPEQTDASTPPGGDVVALYEVYPWSQGQVVGGWQLAYLPDNITRYVTYGASVSIPSENLGFYFAGAKSKSGGPIYYPTLSETLNPDYSSSRLIGIDMGVYPPGNATWSNQTIGGDIQSRSGGELAWVPVSEKGILVGIGGVTEIVYSNVNASFNQSYTQQIVYPLSQ